MFLLLLGVGNTVWAQIGGQFTPLQYSTHTYSIAMGDANFTPVWGVYVEGTDEGDIESGLAVEASDYEVYETKKLAGIAYFTVRFADNNTAMATGNYVIGYKETTNDTKLCTRAVVEPIILYNAFDVDVALHEDENPFDCPDGSGDLKGQDLTSTTTIDYVVYVEYPTAGVPLNGYLGLAGGGTEKWKFTFDVEVNGISGTSATIASIEANALGMATQTFSVTGTPSLYTGTCTVTPARLTPVTFTVVYNDQLGVSQDVSFKIRAIEGAYQEPDIDEVTGAAGNTVTHTIWAMPDVGAITALN
jgi:hypothetical protein